MPTITQIADKARYLVDADSTSYPDSDLRREINEAYEIVVGDILGYDGMWQFDDSNYTTHPIGSADLVAGQHDYAFEDTFLEVLRIEVKDSGGDWVKINQIDRYEKHTPIEELYEDDGLPEVYDVQGGSVFIYPAPATGDVTISQGLRVFFQRTAATFTSAEFSNGTKTPGFASPYHYILAYRAALTYAEKNKPNRVSQIVSHINSLEEKMEKHYSRRNYAERERLGMNNSVNRAM